MSRSNFPIFMFVIFFGLSFQQIVFSQTSLLSSVMQAPSIEQGNEEGVLHQIFASGSQIFYRRSTNFGSNWDIARRISDTIQTNERPSISTGYSDQSPNSDVLRIVWQQKIDNNNYCLWYVCSNDGGSTWTSPQIVKGCSKVTVGDQQSGLGPTPAVASFVEYYSENISDFILVYTAFDGLHYRLCYQNRNMWIIPYSGDIVPGTLNNNSIFFPSLTTYDDRQYHVSLIYNDGSNIFYSQTFSASMYWSPQENIDLSESIVKNSSSREGVSNKIKNYDLKQNYPNPFNPTTQIRFGILKESNVTLKIYNNVGQLVKTLVDGNMSEGYHQVTWDATDNNGNTLSSGVYFYRITAENFVQAKKMILMK